MLAVLPEAIWRGRAAAHADRTSRLLSPGMTPPQKAGAGYRLSTEHPVTNFLQEYYRIKGAAGARRLSRFSPEVTSGGGGTLLHGASADDIDTGTLSARGAAVVEDGVLYDAKAAHADASADNATALLWHRLVLAATEDAEPVLNCYGLHEWAMQYQPDGAPPPPSARYQRHLPLRVDRATINAAVERKGVSCTHVDALRFFAPAAAPLNLHGATLRREQQAELEQPCAAAPCRP